MTFLQHCIHNATVHRSRPTAREAGTRASAKREHIERIAGAARCDIYATVYPQSNPEVVAPLDKLKDMIGAGGGGSLEARISGNDLLILMNKAQRNNNTTF